MFQLHPRYIGVDAGKSSVRFAVLRKIRGGWSLAALKEIQISETNASQFCAPFKEGFCISAVPTRDILMKQCEIQLKKPKDILAALHFHVEPLLPYPIEKACLQAQIVAQKDQTTNINVFALKKDHLNNHLDSFKKLQIEPDLVTTRPQAIAALSRLLPQTSAPFLIIHEAEEEISVVLIEKGSLVAYRSIERKQEISAEIQKTLLSFASMYKTIDFECVYFIGKSVELKKIIQTSCSSAVVYPSSSVISLTQEEWVNFGLAVALALSYLAPNFREKEFAHPNPFKRYKKPLLAYFMLSVLLGSLITFFCESSLRQKKDALSHSYLTFLQTEAIERAAHAKLQSAQDFLDSLAKVEQGIQKKPETFPLYPPIPKVKELLSWLTSLVVKLGKESSSIIMESIHYQLVKRPDFSHKQDPYRVRVDLEIVTKDSNSALLFQEAIKTHNIFVDTQEEIQCVPSSKGKYKISFYLTRMARYV